MGCQKSTRNRIRIGCHQWAIINPILSDNISSPINTTTMRQKEPRPPWSRENYPRNKFFPNLANQQQLASSNRRSSNGQSESMSKRVKLIKITRRYWYHTSPSSKARPIIINETHQYDGESQKSSSNSRRNNGEKEKPKREKLLLLFLYYLFIFITKNTKKVPHLCLIPLLKNLRIPL